MYSIENLSREELSLLSSLVSSAYATAEYRNNHKSVLSDHDRTISKEYFNLISELRLKLIFNIKKM